MCRHILLGNGENLMRLTLRAIGLKSLATSYHSYRCDLDLDSGLKSLFLLSTSITRLWIMLSRLILPGLADSLELGLKHGLFG
jgi:hypothetical protein